MVLYAHNKDHYIISYDEKVHSRLHEILIPSYRTVQKAKTESFTNGQLVQIGAYQKPVINNIYQPTNVTWLHKYGLTLHFLYY